MRRMRSLCRVGCGVRRMGGRRSRSGDSRWSMASGGTRAASSSRRATRSRRSGWSIPS
ncbi:hypothetical protein EMPG_14143 [Blastomyces silverae]|uniref:Uncharacterized protein n=1 Tax=Blastomyces silverae TaxID=2060906 RepID=A0A0H1BG59_9EURO|nr:hypothetical protein EMPG_14143 [Blastomyces silverae]